MPTPPGPSDVSGGSSEQARSGGAGSESRPVFASGLSGLDTGIGAAEHACEQAAVGLGGRPADVAIVFFSTHHIEHARAISATVRRRLKTGVLIGVSGEGVLGGDFELENAPGVSVLAARLPGVSLRPFRLEQLPGIRTSSLDELAALRVAAGMCAAPTTGVLGAGAPAAEAEPAYRGTILLTDPFSVALQTLLPALSAARPTPAKGGADDELPPILGGLASGSTTPGGNALLLDDELLRSGAVGLSFAGAIKIDPLVSQGCRPFGPTLVVTAAKGPVIQKLSGRRALEVLHEAIESLEEPARRLLARGLFIGRAVSEYKDRFGRGDFLIRNIVGVDQDSGSIAVAETVRVGQTVQFQVRDAATADEDLGLLLDAQQLRSTPVGACVFTCNGRGTRLFGRPNHDATAIRRAFAPEPAGETKSKGGTPLAASDLSSAVPLAGFFASGEIGPVGNGVFLHGHTASAALFREIRDEDRRGE